MSSDNKTLNLILTASAVRYVTPYHYAQLCWLIRQAIYNRIDKGTLPVVRLEGPTGTPDCLY